MLPNERRLAVVVDGDFGDSYAAVLLLLVVPSESRFLRGVGDAGDDEDAVSKNTFPTLTAGLLLPATGGGDRVDVSDNNMLPRLLLLVSRWLLPTTSPGVTSAASKAQMRDRSLGECHLHRYHCDEEVNVGAVTK